MDKKICFYFGGVSVVSLSDLSNLGQTFTMLPNFPFLLRAAPFLLLLYPLLFIDLAYHARHLLYARTLHTYLAPGRLGNKVFQNLAVSLLAEKYDVEAHYEMAEEFASLGLRLFSGRHLLDGAEQPLDDEALRRLLDARVPRLHHQQLIAAPHSYFQTPWFARLLREKVLPSMRDSIEGANPWRSRIGRNNDTCLHVRLGSGIEDTDFGSVPLPAYFFPSFLGAVGSPPGRVLIATDKPGAQGVTVLVQALGAQLLDLNAVHTVQFLATCAHLVLSDGTFSWLIGALAMNATTVHYVPRGREWHGDIFVFEDWVRMGA